MASRAALAVALLIAGPAFARADEPALSADRPGFGESASAIAPGRLQIEMGATWTLLAPGAGVFDLPALLVRTGIAGPVELRFTVPDYVRAHPGVRGAEGWTDVAIGLKAHLGPAKGSDFSLRATAYLPTGSAALTDHRVEPEGALAWSRDLSEHWSLGATVSARRFRLLHQTVTSPSFSLGRTLGAHVATFVEYGAGLAQGLRALHHLDHGYTWLLGGHTQLDGSLGVALSSTAPDFFVGVGFCHRF